MSWYSKTYLIFFLYVVPVLFAVMAVYNFALPRQKKVREIQHASAFPVS